MASTRVTIQDLADKVSAVFVPAVITLALLVAQVVAGRIVVWWSVLRVAAVRWRWGARRAGLDSNHRFATSAPP